MNRIEELKSIISHLDTLYEQGELCTHPISKKAVSDTEYDMLRNELYDLCKKAGHDDKDIFNKPTLSKTSKSNNKITHSPAMCSLDKINRATVKEKDEILDKWMIKCADQLGYKYKEILDAHDKFVTTWKHDGVALALYYEKGELKRAGLRSDNGVDGENVTEHCKHIKGVPLKLQLPVTCSIRGEIECLKSAFDRVNARQAKKGEKTYANPRNFTAGSMGLDDPEQLKGRELSFIGYAIENLDNPPYNTELERAKWCNKELGVPFVQVRKFQRKALDVMESTIDEVDYEVDGVVVSVDNLADQKKLGKRGNSVAGNPVGKIAWKFKEQNKVVKVKHVVWNTGRTGRVTPTLHFDAVQLSGTMVSKCTAHNVGIIERDEIGVDALVRVEKSGKIIPKVIGVERSATKVIWPDKCPCCSSALELVENDDKKDLMCENDDCGAKNVGAFVYYLKTLGIKGLADNVVGQLIDNNVIQDFSDFYTLTINDLIDIGITQRTALLTIARIHMVNQPEKIKDDRELAKQTVAAIKGNKKVPLEVFIQALGISGASKGTSKRLTDEYDSIEDIMVLSLAGLEALPDIGGKTAQNLYDYFRNNEKMIKRIVNNHIEFEKKVVKKDGKLKDLSFVFTGKVSKPRKELEALVVENGGKASSSVSKNTSYLVAGDEAGSKLDKAEKLCVKVITEDEFLKMI